MNEQRTVPIPTVAADVPDPRDLHRTIDGDGFVTYRDGYVGDNDHAPPDVDRGGFQWGDEAEREKLWTPGTPLNPKDAAQLRDRKPPLDLLERAANEQIAWVMQHGARKYGRQNYITIPIHARVYAAAVMRHAQQFLDGWDTDTDSGLSHWANIGAGCHVVMGAMAEGTFIDDRGPEAKS